MYADLKHVYEEHESKPFLGLFVKETNKCPYSVLTNIDGQVASLLHPDDDSTYGENDVMIRSIVWLVALAYMRHVHLVLIPDTEHLSIFMDGVWDFWER